MNVQSVTPFSALNAAVAPKPSAAKAAAAMGNDRYASKAAPAPASTRNPAFPAWMPAWMTTPKLLAISAVAGAATLTLAAAGYMALLGSFSPMWLGILAVGGAVAGVVTTSSKLAARALTNAIFGKG